jgi:hypothetical protein
VKNQEAEKVGHWHEENVKQKTKKQLKKRVYEFKTIMNERKKMKNCGKLWGLIFYSCKMSRVIELCEVSDK